MSAPRLEMVGTAPRWPRAAAEPGGGGRLRPGARPAAALGAVGRALLQVMLSFSLFLTSPRGTQPP